MNQTQNDPREVTASAGRETKTVCTGFTRGAPSSSSGSGGVRAAWLDQAVAFTAFRRFNDPAGSAPVETTWRGLIELLECPLAGYSHKKALPLWAPAVFAENHRSRERVVLVHALGFDDDESGASWDEAAAVWARFAGVVHTSWSDSPEKPSRRAVLALSRSITGDEYDRVWSAIAADLAASGYAVGTSRDPSRQWYRPALRPDGAYRFARLSGEVLDVDAILAAAPPPAPQAPPAPARTVAARTSPTHRLPRGARSALRERLEDLDTVAGLLGVAVRSGRGGSVPCPFHADGSPSFSLFPSERGGWAGRCHSEGCSVRGSAFTLIGRRLGISDTRELLEELGRRLGVSVGRPKVEPRTVHDLHDRAHRVLLDVAPLSRAACDYLVARGFQDDEIPLDWAELPAPDAQGAVVADLRHELGEDGWRLSGLADPADPTRFAAPGFRLVVPYPASANVLSPVAVLSRWRLDRRSARAVWPRRTQAPLPYGVEDLDEVAGPDTTLVLVDGPLNVYAVRALAREHGLDWFPIGFADGGSWLPAWAELARGRDVVVALGDWTEAAVASLWLDLESASPRTITRRAPSAGKDWLDVLRDARRKVVGCA